MKNIKEIQVAVAFGIYIAFFILFWFPLQEGVAAFTIVPVMIGAFLLEKKRITIIAILTLPLNYFLFRYFTSEARFLDATGSSLFPIGHIIFISMAYTIGHMRELQHSLVIEVAARKMTINQLTQSEKRYRQLVEVSPNAIFVLIDGTIRFVNSYGLALLNARSKDDVIDRPYLDFIQPKNHQKTHHQYDEIIRTGVVFRDIEETLLDSNGQPIPTEMTISSIYYDDRTAIQVIVQDITLRVKTEESLLEVGQRYKALYDETTDAVFIIGLDEELLEVNQPAIDLLGYQQDELIGMNIADIIPQSEYSDFKTKSELLLKGVNLDVYERQLYRKDNELLHVELNIMLVRGKGGNPLYYQSIARDISERKKIENLLHKKAFEDEGTGISNRSFLIQEISKKLMVPDHKHALLFIDLDNFKPINDNHGHAAGDFILKTVANRFVVLSRQTDIIARYGGDEFVIFLAKISSERVIGSIAERIQKAICDPYFYDGQELFISSSIGISLYPDHGLTAEELISRADQAMYQSKNNGKEKITFYTPGA